MPGEFKVQYFWKISWGITLVMAKEEQVTNFALCTCKEYAKPQRRIKTEHILVTETMKKLDTLLPFEMMEGTKNHLMLLSL